MCKTTKYNLTSEISWTIFKVFTRVFLMVTHTLYKIKLKKLLIARNKKFCI